MHAIYVLNNIEIDNIGLEILNTVHTEQSLPILQG